MAMTDGNTIRLRASCNACNESKVRCSQRKPTCARCERNGAECIYGLSRRTHKDAPPISMPTSRSSRPSRRSSPSRSSSNGDINSWRASFPKSGTATPSTSDESNSSNNINNWRAFPFPKSNTATPSNGGASPDGSTDTHDATLFGDYMSTPPPHHHFMIPQQHSQQNDTHMYTSQSGGNDAAGGRMLDFSSLVTSNNGQLMDPLSALFGGNNHTGDGGAADMATFWARQMAAAGPTVAPPSASWGECTCHGGVTELLASMRGGGGDDWRLSLDAQLAKLKRCIVSSETSMGCTHGREDAEPIHIMAVATLIGYVIDEFKMLASESSLRRAAAEMAAMNNVERGNLMSGMMATGTNMSMGPGGLMEPRLSWGVLELEDDDEMDLRQALYLLSFRKLERLLSQLTLYLRNLHDARASLPDSSGQMAFVMACDYTRMWLEKKAEDVKRLFNISGRGEEMVDPTLGEQY